MSIEIILSIKEAESQAEQIRKQAVEDARQIVSEAREQAYKLMEQSTEDADNEFRRIIMKAEEAAQIEINDLRSTVYEECIEIKQHAGKKLDMAIERIVGRIVNFHGDS